MYSYRITKRIVQTYLRPHRFRIVLATICMIMVAGASAANAYIMQPVLDDIFVRQDRTMLSVIPLIVGLIAVASAVGNYGQQVNMRYVGQHVIATMQMDLFSHLMRADLALFHDQSAGRLISRFTNDIQMMRNAVSNVLVGVVKEALTFVFLVGVMIYQSWELAFIASILFPVAIWPIVRLGKRMRKVSWETQNQLGEFTRELDEVFQGVRVVKAYGAEKHERARAAKRIWDLFGLYYKSARIQAAASPLMEMLAGAAIAAIIWYGGSEVLEGTTTPGAFFSFMMAMVIAYRPVKAMATLNTALQEGLAAASRFFVALDVPPTIQDSPDAKQLVLKDGGLCFDGVSFEYVESGKGVYGIHIEVPAGKTVALVGPSGGGKSTLMNLLLRFYDVDKGSIQIDGQDIRTVSLASLREHIALVSQEVVLFDCTIRENIAYGDLEASEEAIRAAATAAHALKFIEALPDGFDTLVGPHGVKLSGGQRQRLSIARAILKDAPILLLDEATSALDTASERAVQDALEQLMVGRTTLVIAHRLSTIRHADIIYVLEEGRVVESGSHETLLKTKGAYYKLYSTQFQEEAA